MVSTAHTRVISYVAPEYDINNMWQIFVVNKLIPQILNVEISFFPTEGLSADTKQARISQI